MNSKSDLIKMALSLDGCQARGWAYLVNASVNLMRKVEFMSVRENSWHQERGYCLEIS